MALKKSELYASLWRSCDELRGGMDASQYKDYILVLLFMKYVSDKAASQPGYELEVPKGGGFADMVALKNDKEIGDKINKIIGRLAGKNELRGVIDVADFNDEDKLGKGADMVERLTKLITIFEHLDFGQNRAEGDDLLGDAYEYLMRHFATESGKSKGQFYTPAEVSRVMAKVIGVGEAKSGKQTIHDPTCGSGALLLRAHDEAKHGTGLDLALFGQEMDNATRALARMNTILHNCPTAEIWQDNTLSRPHFLEKDGRLKTFDFVVANPPFSTKAWSTGFNPAEDAHRRFEFGIPPKKNGDYAFLLHILACLKSTGKGAVILPHGVLFRGGAEAAIRKEIVKRGYIKGLIGLPANLFYGTGIPACIVVLDREDAHARKGIFMIDASRGFRKDGPKNRLREQDIHKIVDTFARQADLPRYSRMVPLTEIADPKNDYNLNLPRYIDTSEPDDLQDIDAHLRGGIPERDIDALQRYWDVLPSVRQALFESAGRPGYLKLKLPAAEIKPAILKHPEFAAFTASVTKLFDKWKKAHLDELKNLKRGAKPKALIESLSEDLLATFAKVRLLDPYDVYQHLMDYWDETMQDDAYLIASLSWQDAAKLRKAEPKETPDFTVGKQKFKSDLIAASLLIARYFAADQAAIDTLEADLSTIEQQMDELREEHAGDGGLLEEVVDDKGKISKKAVEARLKEIGSDPDYADERELLESYSRLLEKQGQTRSQISAARDALEAKIADKYGSLTVEEIKGAVIDGKWHCSISSDLGSQVDQISRVLTGRIQQLSARYDTTLPVLRARLEEIAGRVDQHLSAFKAAV